MIPCDLMWSPPQTLLQYLLVWFCAVVNTHLFKCSSFPRVLQNKAHMCNCDLIGSYILHSKVILKGGGEWYKMQKKVQLVSSRYHKKALRRERLYIHVLVVAALCVQARLMSTSFTGRFCWLWEWWACFNTTRTHWNLVELALLMKLKLFSVLS